MLSSAGSMQKQSTKWYVQVVVQVGCRILRFLLVVVVGRGMVGFWGAVRLCNCADGSVD